MLTLTLHADGSLTIDGAHILDAEAARKTLSQHPESARLRSLLHARGNSAVRVTSSPAGDSGRTSRRGSFSLEELSDWDECQCGHEREMHEADGKCSELVSSGYRCSCPSFAEEA